MPNPHGCCTSGNSPQANCTDSRTREYDNNLGKLTKIIVKPAVGDSQTRTFTYDALGRLVLTQEPETSCQTFGDFDALNLPHTKVEAAPSPTATSTEIAAKVTRTRSLTLDGLGRLRKVSSSYKGVTAVESFVYDGPRLTDATNTVTADGTTASVPPDYTVSQHYAYLGGADGGFLRSETTVQDGQSSIISYTYSPLGAIQTIKYPSGRTIKYGIDGLGRVQSIGYLQDGDIISSSTFNIWGNRGAVNYTSGAKDEWQPETTGPRLHSWTVRPTIGSAVDWTYAYEPVTGWLNGTGEWGTSNDPLGRLTYAMQNWAFTQDTAGLTQKNAVAQMSTTFSYDAYGNNTLSSAMAYSAAIPTTINRFTFASSLPTNLLPTSTATSPSGSTNATYDSNGTGEMIGVNTGVSTSTALNMLWDPLGRLASVYQSQTGATEVYTYAPSGLRTSRTDSLDPVQDRIYGYTSGGQLLTEFSLPNAAQSMKGVSSSGAAYSSTSSTHGGLQAARIWHLNSTKSSIAHYLTYFAVGDVVTATVWVNAPAGTQGYVKLANYTETSNIASTLVTGTGGWQQVTVSQTITGGSQLMMLALYGNTNLQAANGTFTLYDDVQVSSVAKGVVFTEGFEGGFSVASSSVGWAIRGSADIVTSSSATTFNGQGAVEMIQTAATSNSISRYIGNFASGHILTATLWMKADVGVQAKISLGYTTPATCTVTGSGNWQLVTLQLTLAASSNVILTVKGLTDGSSTYAGYSFWDEVTVADSVNGLVMQDGFEDGLSSAWTKSAWISNIRNLDARDIVYLDGRAIAEIDGTGVHELHCDHLGTPRIITAGGTGLVIGSQTYGPYGETIQAAGYIPATGYTGHLQAEPNGLIYMKARFYSPAWHRFLNSDPGCDPNQLNKYAYCGGNPMVGTDPSGTHEAHRPMRLKDPDTGRGGDVGDVGRRIHSNSYFDQATYGDGKASAGGWSQEHSGSEDIRSQIADASSSPDACGNEFVAMLGRCLDVALAAEYVSAVAGWHSGVLVCDEEDAYLMAPR